MQPSVPQVSPGAQQAPRHDALPPQVMTHSSVAGLHEFVPFGTDEHAVHADVQLWFEIATHCVPQRCSPGAQAHCALHVPSSHSV
jgi:hypothetical protein